MALFFALCCVLFLLAVVMVVLPEKLDPEEKHSGSILLVGIFIAVLLSMTIVILMRRFGAE